jgi:hypothetical protein
MRVFANRKFLRGFPSFAQSKASAQKYGEEFAHFMRKRALDSRQRA